MVVEKCPTHETLLKYSLGKLPEKQSDALAGHLDSCPDCQATIVTLEDAEDTLIERLRMPLDGESYSAEPLYQAALDEAVAMPRPGKGDSPHLPERPFGCFAQMGTVPFSHPDMPQALGEYEILEELGHGGMGRVYKALHTKLDRVVALKVLPRGRLGDRQSIARFEREMRAVGRLTHPNIVHAFDARDIDDTPVLIMECVDGLDLGEIVRRLGLERGTGPVVPIAEACELVRQTALALQYAHEHELVHRDIKPSNIMLAAPLSRSGRGAGGEGGSAQVKLLDLGLAKFYAGAGKGDRSNLCEAPGGPFRQIGPVPFSRRRQHPARCRIRCLAFQTCAGDDPGGIRTAHVGRILADHGRQSTAGRGGRRLADERSGRLHGQVTGPAPASAANERVATVTHCHTMGSMAFRKMLLGPCVVPYGSKCVSGITVPVNRLR